MSTIKTKDASMALNRFLRRLIYAITAAVVLLPAAAGAHQARLAGVVKSGPVPIRDPEISKAFYDELDGTPRIYQVESAAPFVLYLNIVVPQRSNPNGRYTAEVVWSGDKRELVATLPAGTKPWKEFHEPFAGDRYLRGPELRQEMPPGRYEIIVSGNGNRGKYALAVGEGEVWPLKETLHALRVIPGLKKDFFNASPATFALSIFGGIYLSALIILGVCAGALYRKIMQSCARPGAGRGSKNIDKSGRLLRCAAGIGLLVWALTTSWNPFLIIISGFTFFEALAGWCGLYAALGRTTCRTG